MASGIIKPNTTGFMKDGKPFQILEINKLCISDDGTVHSGVLTVKIDNETGVYPLSVIAENIEYNTLS